MKTRNYLLLPDLIRDAQLKFHHHKQNIMHNNNHAEIGAAEIPHSQNKILISKYLESSGLLKNTFKLKKTSTQSSYIQNLAESQQSSRLETGEEKVVEQYNRSFMMLQHLGRSDEEAQNDVSLRSEQIFDEDKFIVNQMHELRNTCGSVQKSKLVTQMGQSQSRQSSLMRLRNTVSVMDNRTRNRKTSNSGSKPSLGTQKINLAKNKSRNPSSQSKELKKSKTKKEQKNSKFQFTKKKNEEKVGKFLVNIKNKRKQETQVLEDLKQDTLQESEIKKYDSLESKAYEVISEKQVKVSKAAPQKTIEAPRNQPARRFSSPINSLLPINNDFSPMMKLLRQMRQDNRMQLDEAKLQNFIQNIQNDEQFCRALRAFVYSYYLQYELHH